MLVQPSRNPVQTSGITLPADQYAHNGAPTEWWWHIGTLQTADGRQFGFEINACGANVTEATLVFTEIAIADVKNQIHYQIVNDHVYPSGTTVPKWAEDDTSKPWFVNVSGIASNPTNGSVLMEAINGNPLNMAVQASFVDATTNTQCVINLRLLQQGPPLLVWGTGVHPVNSGGTPITDNNYYYSLTNLNASGSIIINNEVFEVTGVTWMDHEYGAFPNPPGGKNIWTLQDMQLANGLHLSNYTKFEVMPQNNVPMPSNATLLLPTGESVFVDTVTTPMNPMIINNNTYFAKFKVEITSKGHSHIQFIIENTCPNQVFVDPLKLNSGYEGVAKCDMIVSIHLSEKITRDVIVSSGTAWIEQSLGYS